MAFIRTCFVMLAMMFVLCSPAQTISYPLQSSRLLRSTAADAAMLFQKAIAGSQFHTSSYATIPQQGIIFIYDSTITHNQACRVESDGINYIKFSASQDNGLCFGIYQYLQNLGFRFYQPGSIWEIIPSLTSPYKKTDSIFTARVKYNSWFISGGHNRWVMDNDNNYAWDTYFGENGHNWALYQRRNGMTGAYRFAGHRSDIMSGNYFSTLQNNPCYVACYDSSRQADSRSVPDVNNAASMQLWASAIEQNYAQYRNTIFGNPGLYTNQYRNYNYNNFNIGIEVPDGAKWGNSANNLNCASTAYGSESDQQFTLANYTAQKISTNFPALRYQLYAYSTHANTPSANIVLSNKLDVQLIPEVYQHLTSTNGLRKRWYSRTKNISEYNYLNLPDWSGETPAFHLGDFKRTLQVSKDNNSQGLTWEASPAKFASLPYLLAAAKNLQDNVAVDNTLRDFCDKMFGAGSKTILSLLQLWTDDKAMAGGISNRYKLQLYLQKLVEANQQIAQEPEIVKARLRELKAYLHYMALYYDWSGDQRPRDQKAAKAGALCIYLAKINKMQLVNSYYLVAGICAGYNSSSNFFLAYNPANGTAYQNGNLALITAAEIENDFAADVSRYGNIINAYKFEPSDIIATRVNSAGLKPRQQVNVKLTYTNGMDYYNRAEFFINAPAAGSFTCNYKPMFDMPGKGYINFTVESTDKTLEVIEDLSLDKNAKAGSFTISLPAAGNYKMTVSSKYRSSVELEINTNKNIFYKSGAFFGKATEVYPNDKGMPGYFYIPAGISRVYFSLGNSNPGGAGFASEEKINNAFAARDHNGKPLTAKFAGANDSALLYIDIPKEAAGKFCSFTKKGNYDLLFANISNYVWYAEPRPASCGASGFTINSVNQKGNCITRLAATSNAVEFNWEVTDLGKTYTFSNQRVVDLPVYSSPNALVTLTVSANCSTTKKVGDDENFLKSKQSCASGGPLAEPSVVPVIYPNPSSGIFRCMVNGDRVAAGQVQVFNAQGKVVATFFNTDQFNIGDVGAGIYWYRIIVKGVEYSGKLVKI